MRAVLATFLAVALAGPAEAAHDPFGPGSLDASFATRGVVRSSLRLYEARTSAVGVDKRGRTYVLASGGVIGRFLRSGRIDRSYGRQGFAKLPFTSAEFDGNAYAQSLSLTREGAATVAGMARRDTLFVARLTADGERDDGFGDFGVTTVWLGVEAFGLTGIEPGPQGRIVTAAIGYGLGEPGLQGRALLVGLLSSGRLDHAFGTDGIAQSPAGGGLFGTGALTHLGDQLAILVGDTPYYDSDRPPMPVLIRSDPTGSQLSVEPSPIGALPLAAHPRPQGGLLVLGAVGDASRIAALTETGAIDESFGRAGSANVGKPPFGFGDAVDFIFDPARRILVVRTLRRPGRAMGLTRLTSAGRVDGGFGRGGTAVVQARAVHGSYDPEEPPYASAEAVAYDAARHRIYLAGSYGDGPGGIRDDMGGDVVELAALRTGYSLATVRSHGRVSGSALRVRVRCRAAASCRLQVLGGRRPVRLRLGRGRHRNVALALGSGALQRIRRGGTLRVTVLASAGTRHDGIVAAVRG